jgi:hypothetical protein
LNAVPEDEDSSDEGKPEDRDGDGSREPVIRISLCVKQIHTD